MLKYLIMNYKVQIPKFADTKTNHFNNYKPRLYKALVKCKSH